MSYRAREIEVNLIFIPNFALGTREDINKNTQFIIIYQN